MYDTDVLIIGGGPTGVALALELAVQKVPFRIVDKEPQRSDKSRALAVQARTLELLNRHGDVQNDFLPKGNRPSGMCICFNGKKAAEMLTSDSNTLLPNTRFRLPALINQSATETFLDDLLAKHGAAVERPVEVKRIEQDDEGVSVTLVEADGSEGKTRARYVVGADGAHSIVRHSAKNVTFEGAAYPQEYILADTHVKSESDLPLTEMCMCVGEGLVAVLPLNPTGTVRVFASREVSQQDHRDPTLQEFQDLLPHFVPGGEEMTLHDPIWLSRFKLHHRAVNRYRDGRLFVAGDAAHVHSPAGGQGMNTGIQDSINLGWKLAAVIRGEEPDSFLDSYDAERRPIGRYLLQGSDRMFTFLTTTNPFYMFLRNWLGPWIMPWVMSRPQFRRGQFWHISQLGVRYRRGGIVGTAAGFEGKIRGGDRVIDGKIKDPAKKEEIWLQDLLTPETYHLLLFSGPNGGRNTSEGDLHRAEAKFLEQSPMRVKVHPVFGEGSGVNGYKDVGGELHKAFGFDNKAGYVLVRPDSYIAHIGPLSAFDQLFGWLKSS